LLAAWPFGAGLRLPVVRRRFGLSQLMSFGIAGIVADQSGTIARRIKASG